MKLGRTYLPLPMYINKYDSILRPKQSLTKNEELMWVLKKGLTIGSLGFHRDISKQGGKSSLLNQVFFTNLVEKPKKHKGLLKIPYISICVYDDLFPVHIIDIPSDCPKKIQIQLLQLCDIYLFHSWRGQQETKELVKGYEKPYICLLRDSHDNHQDSFRKLKKITFQTK